MTKNRREFLQGLVGVSVSPFLMPHRESSIVGRFPISCSSYDWVTFYQRQGRTWWAEPKVSAEDLVASGLMAIEPNIEGVAEARQMIQTLRAYDIQMPSIYVNSLLHERAEADNSIALVMAIASEVKGYGTKILVTNPSPIQWDGKVLKSDAQLIEQAINLDRLGKALKDAGMTLAYHTHDTELLAGAREFHHMMLNTSPDHVAFCFDVHWMYRGSDNSQVAVFDVLKLYGHRIVELHLRQSSGGIWTETFGEGDIDYGRVSRVLHDMKLRPHLVIEQCIQPDSPNTMDGVQAHKLDLATVKKTFQQII